MFDKKEFIDYAKKNLVLVELDYPMKKKLPPDVTTQNDRLMRKYNIYGFPTIVLLDSSAQTIGLTGYENGGVPVFLDNLQTLRNKSKAK